MNKSNNNWTTETSNKKEKQKKYLLKKKKKINTRRKLFTKTEISEGFASSAHLDFHFAFEHHSQLNDRSNPTINNNNNYFRSLEIVCNRFSALVDIEFD